MNLHNCCPSVGTPGSYTSVGVAVSTGTGVAVGIGVGVLVGVAIGVSVGRRVGVSVAVGILEKVAVFVDLAASVSLTCCVTPALNSAVAATMVWAISSAGGPQEVKLNTNARMAIFVSLRTQANYNFIVWWEERSRCTTRRTTSLQP